MALIELVKSVPDESFQDFIERLRPALSKRLDAKKIGSLREFQNETGLQPEEFANAVAEFTNSDRISYDELATHQTLENQFSARFLRENNVLPFLTPNGAPAIAICWPPTEALIDAIEIVIGKKSKLFAIATGDLDALLSDRLTEPARETISAVDDEDAMDAVANGNLDNLRDLASGAPVVRAVNELFDRAMEVNATDLHIEPMRNTLNIRLRVDGLLQPIASPPRMMAPAIISRIKILAGLNIAERRLPQDGAARILTSGGAVDIRVAIMPSPHGETAVIRILPRERGVLDLATIGLSLRSRVAIDRVLTLSHGLVIITGPTGSGKTTTLASALTTLNQPHRKILTIEDPIEYEIQGICQSQVKPEIGLTFATAMRAFVRQDPDVIMVGEIRDAETASIAINAALTGHLVLTTLHTETAAAAIPRLIDLGVDDFLLRSTLRAVVAQRLVRILCAHCKVQKKLTYANIDADPRLRILNLNPGDIVCEPVGCDRCNHSGFRGRVGIFEILEPTGSVRKMIRNGIDAETIEEAASREGFLNMATDALEKCYQGITAPSEILRVTPQRVIL